MSTISKPEELFYLHCRADNLNPHRQFKFHPTRKWLFDFAWPEKLVACEIEGGIWLGANGGHTGGRGYENNCEKYNAAILLDWRVLRFTPSQVKSGYAIEITKKLIKRLTQDDHSRPY